MLWSLTAIVVLVAATALALDSDWARDWARRTAENAAREALGREVAEREGRAAERRKLPFSAAV